MHKALFAALLLLPGLALAQGDTQTVSPQTFLKQEGVKNAYTTSNSTLQPADALNLLLQCTPPISTTFDSDGRGRNDTLRTYGFSMVDAQVYRLRGPGALSTALQKAQLRAQGAAAEFFEGVRTAVSKGLDKRNTTASGISNNELQLGDLEVETLRETVNTNAEAVLRYGRMTGTRLVSLGEHGLCVVVRYELPLDQRPRSSSGGGAAAPGLPGPAGGSGGASGGLPLPPPGRVGDF